MYHQVDYICNMEIKDRIRMIIDSHQLTAGAFADRIGVQRSNVSHVLSGRNKPSFEFVEKVLLAFPKVQAHWLLTGKQAVGNEPASEKEVGERSQIAVKPHEQTPAANQQPERKIVKIVTFYSDFTFDTYFPNAQ